MPALLRRADALAPLGAAVLSLFPVMVMVTIQLAAPPAHAEDWRDKLKQQQEEKEQWDGQVGREQGAEKNMELEPGGSKPAADIPGASLAPATGAGSVLNSPPTATEEADPTEPYKNSVQISLGAYLPWMNRFTRTTTGEASPTGQILPTLGGAYRFHWERFPGLSFSTQGWFTPMGAAIADGGGSTRWLSGALIAGLQEKQAEFRLGTGFLMELIRGAGGTIELGNAGGTATFYQPGRSVVGRVLTLNLGFSYQRGRWRYEADGMIVGALSSRRGVGLILQAGYGLF